MAITIKIIIVVLVGVRSVCGGDAGKDVHDVLVDHGFPEGVIPLNVESYNFNQNNKTLTVKLNKSECRVNFKDWFDKPLEFRYGKTIKVEFDDNKLKEVTGIHFRYSHLQDEWSPVSRMVSQPSDGLFIIFGQDNIDAFMHYNQFKTIPSCNIANKDVRKVLADHDLPVGLYPNNVDWYNLNEKNGNFTVRLNKSECHVNIKDWPFGRDVEFRYKENITATLITKGRLTDVTGIHLKFGDLWSSVSTMMIGPRESEIFMIIGEGFQLFVRMNQFETIPSCHDAIFSNLGQFL